MPRTKPSGLAEPGCASLSFWSFSISKDHGLDEWERGEGRSLGKCCFLLIEGIHTCWPEVGWAGEKFCNCAWLTFLCASMGGS